MGTRELGRPEAKAAVAAAIKATEAAASVEVVVAVRRSSGHYRGADFAFAALCTLAALAAMLYLPDEFPLWSFLVDLPILFAVAALAASRSLALRRALTSRRVREANVQRAAKAALVDLGVTRTSQRQGVLVYLSLLERAAAVVPDHGLEAAAQGEAWAKVVEAVRAAGRKGSLELLTQAVAAIGPALAKVRPRRAGEKNELPDELTEGA